MVSLRRVALLSIIWLWTNSKAHEYDELDICVRDTPGPCRSRCFKKSEEVYHSKAVFEVPGKFEYNQMIDAGANQFSSTAAVGDIDGYVAEIVNYLNSKSLGIRGMMNFYLGGTSNMHEWGKMNFCPNLDLVHLATERCNVEPDEDEGIDLKQWLINNDIY